jgi:hypothetical protein
MIIDSIQEIWTVIKDQDDIRGKLNKNRRQETLENSYT